MPPWVIDGEHADPVAFCPDARLVAAASSRAGGDIRILRVADGKVLAKLNGFRSRPRAYSLHQAANR
jgi:hypothetical protein